ncbi:flagellar protein FlaJ [Methanobrevibacter gottschalkii]|uniref:Flagellar protein FlaJ n=2 Tax=Methanobrevibacter gottschalkii TaxID=190974 RepID=A0A3N5C940_9EURY|nr:MULTISPECIES: type II secretion system F family protein [Methanobrevibacter]MCQ2970324.1 type II secretion system F family protein [archaeon]RPF53121.1 flagellar protein FlaJ [Methanobrevibacter gottschalkii DSM 11977]SEK61492.1 flagellar protein FlaJ [Methanobrevibacter gottschalkii]
MINIIEEFFIAIGGISLFLIDFFKNFSLKEIEIEKTKDINQNIAQKLNLQKDIKLQNNEKDSIDKIRRLIIPYLTNKKIIGLLGLLFLLINLFISLEISGIYIVLVLMTYIFVFYYPQIQQQRNYSDINQELPYALRHIGIELKSGKGLHDTLRTIKNADYGSISQEFNRILEEIKFGKSTEESLLEMSTRVKSEGLTRAIHQIISTLRVGGNLSNSLDIIAKDISFDMQIKLKEYSQKLNSFILIYTFIAILTPVISLIMLMASSTVMGDILSSSLLFILYGVFFPSIVVFMGVFIKKLEPKI